MEILNNRKKLAILAISIVVLLTVVSISVILFVNSSKSSCDSSQVHTSYFIEIMPPQNESYMLILPIPIYEDGRPAQVAEKLKVTEGDASFETAHESYGWVLKVYGKGHAIIGGSAHYFKEPTFPSIINSSGPPLQNTKYSWEENIPSYWNSSVYSNKSLTLSIDYTSWNLIGCYNAEGISWGTYKWIDSENRYEDSVFIEGGGWSQISLDVKWTLK